MGFVYMDWVLGESWDLIREGSRRGVRFAEM